MRNKLVISLRYLLLSLLSTVLLTGCASTAQTIALGVGAGSSVLGVTPNGGIEQTYYLGIYDPREQIATPQFYRVKVRGQSSVLSNTKFSSGWVRADLVDSLSTLATFNSKEGGISWTGAEEAGKDKINTGRRLVLFGPEGFREAPSDHRLAIVMSANPEAFFSAIDESLGLIAQATQKPAGAGFDEPLFERLSVIRSERERLGDLLTDLKDKGE